MLGVQELIIILLIVVLVFGGKRIPEIMSGLGKGIKSFKKAVDGEDDPADQHASTPGVQCNSNVPKTPEYGSELKKNV